MRYALDPEKNLAQRKAVLELAVTLIEDISFIDTEEAAIELARRMLHLKGKLL